MTADDKLMRGILRTMAWERAKGELRSMVETYNDERQQFESLNNAVEQFIEYIEDNAIQE